MRSDASALLQKLNRQGINYREFPDRYADLELWPIFEALLNDPRVVERRLSRVEQRESEFAASSSPGAGLGDQINVPEGHPLEQQFSSLLSAYAPQPADGAEAAPGDGASQPDEKAGKPDLRSFLNHLGARGQ